MKLKVGMDSYNFHVGQPVELLFEHGRWRRASRFESLRFAVHRRWQHWTRWWRPRTVCTMVDMERGSITVADERWSWRRWRWESAA